MKNWQIYHPRRFLSSQFHRQMSSDDPEVSTPILPLALRLDRNPPSLQAMNLSTTQGQPVSYRLLNLPHYLCAFAGRLHDL